MSYPQKLLKNLCWSFVSKPFTDKALFNNAVIAYQKAIFPQDDVSVRWIPEVLLLPNVTTIELWYEGINWEAEALEERIISVRSELPEGFTALELMYQIHNAVVKELNEIDHHFFEGLNLNPESKTYPIYEMWCGS